MEIQQIVPSTEILFVHTSYTIDKFGKTKLFTPILIMTVELYQQHMINRNGWAMATEIEAAANLFGLNINIWLQQSSHCTLSSLNASSPTCIDILLSRNHLSPLKRVPSNTENSLDILKNQFKRQGQ